MPSEPKIALVTGSTGALGRVVTKSLLEHGIKVVSTFRSAETEKDLETYLGDLAKDLTPIEADLTDEKSVEALFEKVVAKSGRIDILVNIVGGYKGGDDIAHTKLMDWDMMMNLNLKSAFLCSKHALLHMIGQNYGKIVNVSARPAVERRFRAKSGAYAVSKAGVAVLTETIAEEVKKLNINVNAIMPSTIDTPGNRTTMANADPSNWVRPEDIANVILFLVSDDSRVTSGAVIPVYGKA